MIFVLMIVTIGVTTISCSFDKWPDEMYTEDTTLHESVIRLKYRVSTYNSDNVELIGGVL